MAVRRGTTARVRLLRGPVAVVSLVAGAAFVAAAWATLIDPRRTVVRQRTLRLPGWPADLDGLRLALVGDLHAGAAHVDAERVERLAAAIARRRPDAVLFAGDLMDDESVGADRLRPATIAAALAGAGAPRFAVLGNHDRTFGARTVRRALIGAGFSVLENASEPVDARGRRAWIAGVADDDSATPRPDAALAGVPDGEPVVVLTHSPDVFPRIPERVALTVAGHTHGGQVAVPGPLRARVIPSRFGDRYARGHIVEAGRHLFVTSGVGTSRWPIRFGIPSEVVLLKLRARRGAGR